MWYTFKTDLKLQNLSPCSLLIIQSRGLLTTPGNKKALKMNKLLTFEKIVQWESLYSGDLNNGQSCIQIMDMCLDHIMGSMDR